jgi:hypothetical protein
VASVVSVPATSSVPAEKRGRWVYYQRNEATLARLAEAVKVAV